MSPRSRLLCRLTRAMTLLAALLLPAFVGLVWLSPSAVLGDHLARAGLTVQQLDMAARSRAFLVCLPGLAVAAWALLQLWRLLGLYLAGQALTARAQLGLQRFAWSLVGLALLGPLTSAALSVALTLGNAPGERRLVVALSSDQYAFALLSLLLVLIARVMRDAVRAAEDNAGFV